MTNDLGSKHRKSGLSSCYPCAIDKPDFVFVIQIASKPENDDNIAVY
jgi:hypothetical protein